MELLPTTALLFRSLSNNRLQLDQLVSQRVPRLPAWDFLQALNGGDARIDRFSDPRPRHASGTKV